MKKHIKILAILAVLFLFASGTSVLYAQGNGTTTGTTTRASADATAPSDVAGLKAAPGDAEVLLTWEPAADDVEVTGYKVYRGTKSVQKDSDQYDLPTIPLTGKYTTYTVKNLTNGQKYYFAVTAVDAAGNESESYYVGDEVSATPKSGLRTSSVEDDGKPPQVKEVKAEDVITVLFIFSEPVKLPAEAPASAFKIEKLADKSRLQVQKAEIDKRDASGATVLLTTAQQEENAEYIVTAGIEIQDLLGNPIVSGTSDTGSLKGSAKKKAEEKPAETPAKTETGTSTPPAQAEPVKPADTEPPVVTGGSADYDNRMTVMFSEKIKLPDSPKSQFSIAKKDGGGALKIVNVSLSVDGKTAYITTEPQQSVEYAVKVAGIKDEAGNEISAQADSVSITGRGSALTDLVPPEDITKLIARIKNAKEHIVELKWEASKNSAGDLADQVLYQGEGRKPKEFSSGTSLGTSTVTVEVQDLAPGKWHTFKVAAKDTVGNESKGTLASVYLPQTGPGVVAAGLTALLMAWRTKRKKAQR